MLLRKSAAGLAFCLLLGSCSFLGTGDDEKDALEEHQSLWERQEIEDYQYDLQVRCFCPRWLYPATIKVHDDTVAAVLDPETGDTLRTPDSGSPALQEAPDGYPTVEGLFEVVERAIDEEYHRLSVEYNDRYGYQEEIDYEVGENVTDDEVRYNVTNFEEE